MTTPRRLALLATLLLVVFGAAIALTPSEAQVGTGTPKRNAEKDLADLQRLTGDGKVSVYLLYNQTVFTGRLKGVTSALGRTYVQLQNDATETILINVENISAIRQTFN